MTCLQKSWQVGVLVVVVGTYMDSLVTYQFGHRGT